MDLIEEFVGRGSGALTEARQNTAAGWKDVVEAWFKGFCKDVNSEVAKSGVKMRRVEFSEYRLRLTMVYKEASGRRGLVLSLDAYNPPYGYKMKLVTSDPSRQSPNHVRGHDIAEHFTAKDVAAMAVRWFG